MHVKKAIRDIMDIRGIGTNALARKMGKIPQTVVDRLSPSKSTNLSVNKLSEFTSALGYKIVLVPDGTEIQDGWYEIEDSRESEGEA